MNNLNIWVAMLCAVSIICTIFELVSPKGNMQKNMNFVLALFMLCCVIVPIIKNISSFEINLKKVLHYDSYQAKVEEIADIRLDFATQKINKLVDKTLNENGIKAEKIETDMNIDEEQGISINKTTVYINKQDEEKKAKIQGVIHRKLELPCEIVIIQEN